MASLGIIGFEQVHWEGAFLYGAQLGGANFSLADVYWVNFSTAHLGGTNFVNADMQGADLSNASCV
ncbi:pentapeptide repeat-containing protein [Ruegeria sp. HKCCD7255]|uniref:pentapeptide repeat-containing protein n=1 Tax=Ruegeria sp. HKCCD7255 TaxID=2683004 RepID=UPI001488D4A3